MLLTMVPGVVSFAEMEYAWAKTAITPDQHARFLTHLKTALRELDKARSAVTPATPSSAGYYLHFQRWRILQTWRSVINSIKVEGGGEPERVARNNAEQEVTDFLGGTTPKEAAGEARDKIAKGHALRVLIDRLETQ